VLTQDKGVDPERDRRVRVSETVGDHMHRHAGQQEVRGMNESGLSVTCHARASRSTLRSTLATPSCPRQDRSRCPAFSGGITVRGYPLSMVLAEKIVTAVQRGTVNTRWRDNADVALLSAAHDVNGDELVASIDVVARHRNATLTSLAEALAGYVEIAQNKWSAWVRKQRLTDRLDQDFARVLQDVLTFAGPAVSGAIKGLTWAHRVGRWMPRWRRPKHGPPRPQRGKKDVLGQTSLDDTARRRCERPAQ
jgi:Nucleotidyl transferase AbiEii toxin, Type IV TA system